MRGGGRFGSDYKRRLAADMAKKKTEKFSSPPPAERQPSTFNRIVEGVKTAARIGEESFYPTYGQVGAPNPLAVFGSPTFRRTGIGQSLARSEIGRRLIESQASMGEAAGGYTGPVSTVSRGVSEPSPVNVVLAGLTLGEFFPGGRGAKAVKQSIKQSKRMGIMPRINNEDEYVEDVFELERPLAQRGIIPETTSVYETTPEMAQENALIDALVRQTERKAKAKGIPMTEIPDVVRERAYGGKFDMFKVDPDTGEYVMDVKSFALSDEGIKRQALKTLKDGMKRQEEYGIDIDEVPYKTWKDIPDWFVEQIRRDYAGAHRVQDVAGRVMSHLGLTLDHDEALRRGGPNTLEGLVGMQGRFNFKKGDRPK